MWVKAAMAERERERDETTVAGRVRDGATGWIGRSRAFLSGVRNEMARVTWPSRREVYATTIVVILTSILFGVYLWSVDLMLSAVISRVLNYFGAA
jgi:preprotein translocase subunit SecE